MFCAGPFDEGAAQVANLLERDEDELTGKSGIGERAFSEFGQTAGKDNLLTIEDFPDAFKPAGGMLPSCPSARRMRLCWGGGGGGGATSAALALQ